MKLLLVVTISAGVALCQQAQIAGLIRDPSGLSVAGAEISVRNEQTGGHRQTLTDESGFYSVASLNPGTYRILVRSSGFETIVQESVKLEVGDNARLDFTLRIGDSRTIVTVHGGPPLMNASAVMGPSTVVDRPLVESLPLNGRSLQPLFLLSPGTVVTATAFDDQGQFSVNGQRADANYFTVDGVSANFGVTGYQALVQTAGGALPALSVAGLTNSLVSVDAIEELHIQTSPFAPEFGRTPGAQISIITRSGTNEFHGTLFEYFRNDVLDAKDWFVNFNGLAKPAERHNDFGGVFGGPVIRNKTFFFFSYEGLRLRQPKTQETVVPDAASRQQAPSAIQPYLNAFPISNGLELGSGLAQFNAGYSNPSSLNAYSIRVDQAIGSKLNLFGRYNYSPSSLVQRGPALGAGTVVSLTEPYSSHVQTGTIGLTESITPAISNEARANYSNQRVGTRDQLDNFGGAVPLPDSLLFPAGISSANGAFTLYVPGVGEYNQGIQSTDEQRQINLIDNLSVTKGGHQLKFGLDYRWLAPFTVPYAYRAFAEVSTPGGILSGTAQVAATYTDQSAALLSQNFSFYGQDTWKVAPRLTVTYGLRWDINPAIKGKVAADDPYTVTGLDSPATLALAPHGTPLFHTTYANVAPRLGLAYQLGGKPNWGATLRGGFGIFYDLGNGPLGGVSSYFPYEAGKVIIAAPFPLSPQNAIAPTPSTNPPIANILVSVPNLKLPRSYQWNIAVEQSMGSSQSLSLTYVGAIGRDLLRVTDLFNVNPTFESVNLTDNTATSDYHALQIKFQRRLAQGLQALGSYTLSHSIDSASTDAFANYLSTPASLAMRNVDRGDSDFDIRHAFSTGITYDLPSVRSSQVMRALLGGWSLDGLAFARSAPPLSPLETLSDGAGIAFYYPRPNVVPGVPLYLYGPGYPGGKTIDKAAFVAAPSGQQGDFSRNVLRGFDAAQVNLGVQRRFGLTEKVGLLFRSEFFNILNHPNFGNPTNSLTSPLFGYSTQTLANALGSGGANGGLNPLYQIGGPRSIQLALRLTF